MAEFKNINEFDTRSRTKIPGQRGWMDWGCY